ncbi:siderophore-interacting protein [Actinoplanes ianthinogenes]|uniref:Siderophore-interacting protein n=1 Tax=Actinoplanes ianthinogenes TaxID=122358 RepID=A0ABM7LPD2_9ACTN|nr:siderophore-interacting protein [Actinoplanes ianthinogenes]BCJ41139.1 siderophore-interacting protein [Actinoplanes ianthinogenes]GGR22647.1 siderophore-interacting protein [Actinoplanes ianthinogenes]
MAVLEAAAPTLDRRGTGLRDPQFLRGTVRRITYVTEHVKRITIVGAALCGLPVPPPAAKVRLFLPPAVTALPEFPLWTPRGLLWAPGASTAMRSYTVRRHDPGTGEIDVDILLHGNGPGSQWAATARTGARVGFLRPESGYLPRPDVARHLLIGDESALPAIAAILESLAPATSALAIVETGDRCYRRYPGAGPIRWLDRGDRAPGAALWEYVRELPAPDAAVQAFVAGEATPTRLIRQHLRDVWGLSTRDGTLQAKGYWAARPR